MSISRNVKTERSTGTGREVHEDIPVKFPNTDAYRSAAVIGKLTETVGVAAFTDGGAAVGTYTLAGKLPAGAIFLFAKVTNIVGFAGDTTAVLTIGDGSDADRYNTGTINVFATAAAGVEAGVPSGAKLLTADNNPVLTVTGGADFTSIVTEGNGSLQVDLYYIDA